MDATLTTRVTAAGRLTALVAALSLAISPLAVRAQDRSTDKALEDLIPDSAIDNAKSWANDTDAAHQPSPDAEAALKSVDPAAPMADLPDMTIDWPAIDDMPKVERLAPDPDIAEARKAAGEAVDGLASGGNGDTVQAMIADAEIIPVGKQVELAFPREDGAVPQRQALADRFATLSSLRSLDTSDDSLAQLARRARSDSELLDKLLRYYGYYGATVYQSVQPRSQPAVAGAEAGNGGAPAASTGNANGRRRSPLDAEGAVVRFDIVPGAQYRVGGIALGDLDQTGDDYAKLRDAFALKTGDPLETQAILEGAAALDTALGENGYAFATTGEPSLMIDHKPETGDVTVPVENNGKYRFGQMVSELPKFLSSHHLHVISRFHPGDVYKRSDVTDLRQAILATGLVSSVTITPRKTQESDAGVPGTVDLDVAMTKAPLRTIAGQLGYSTGQGFRLEGSWENRNLFPPEGMLRVRGVAGTDEQLAGITFRRNNFMRRDQVLTADLYGQTLKTNAYDASTISLLTTIERQQTLIFQKPFIWSVGLQLLATRETDAPDANGAIKRSTYFISALPLHIAFDYSDDLLDPTRGYRLSLRGSPEYSVSSGVNSQYVKLQFDGSYYHPVGDGKVVLAGRVRVGSIVGHNTATIAPSRRFYAGGAGSVRGYGYQKVGPRDVLGDPAGGTSLTEFSLEARIRTGLVGGAVSVVPFLDAGTVGTGRYPTLKGMKYGAGVGLRYLTNFGPIRIDVGTPLNREPGDSRIGVYVALGQAF
ncbi:MAG: BamA/TamA family outer membrane protein [Sphingomonadales bacterium]|nr:BamA/TamA family outer membrane protein [Sphingomonadales bacterium]MDE2567608.1 BamA/TamA family outer membrane protein [Sphingomonadales bacterium]